MSARKTRLPFANAWFFPAAALYAAVLLPWSVLALFGLLPTPAGLLSPLGHAHEMLFGFALAVVAGYLLGPQPLPLILSLLGCWALARLGWLFWPGAWWTVVAAALFAGGVAWNVVPRFLGAAKKWRNQIVAPVVASLALLSAIASLPLPLELTPHLMHEALLLLAMLLFFMGGRIIAPAVAGHMMSQGHILDARVQPRLEGAALILLGLALLSNLLPWALASQVSGFLLLSVGLLAGVRLLRWQPWRCARRPDLLVLLLGYLWLSVGLLLFGLALLTTALPLSASLHGLTIGALGTLTFAVMARTRLIYRLRDANARPWIHPVAVLLSLAALARILPPLLQLEPFPWLLLSAACWSLAFLLLAVLLWQTRGRFNHKP